MKAFAYLRVSDQSQISGDGFDRQRDKIAQWAAANKIEIAREFVDAGVSGRKELEARPALSKLIAAIQSNGVRLVLVERADRFARDLMVGEIILERFRSEGVKVIECEDGRELTANDPDNATGTLVRQVLAAIAQFEKTGLVSKLRKARERKRAETGHCEGVKPFGTLPGEQDAIERIRQLRRKPVGGNRLSLAKIARRLDDEGFKTREGRPWQASTVRAILGRKLLDATRPTGDSSSA